MARLQVEVRPGAGVGGYSLFVDGIPAAMDPHHKGEVICAGRCGDGSPHALLYSFAGLPGATLAITIRCSASIVFGPRVEIIGPAGSRWRAGREVFSI
ncbi:MAG: hypothetical protein WBR13_05790 [Allosphingosinicella sp.]